MQHAPHIDVIAALNIEHHERITRQRPEPQPRKIQLAGSSWRAGGRMATNIRISRFQGFDEAEGGMLRSLVQILGDGGIDVRVGPAPGNDGPEDHLRALGLPALRTRSRSPWKYDASAGAAGFDLAPSISRSRSCARS